MLFNSIRVNELKFNLFHLRVEIALNANCGILDKRFLLGLKGFLYEREKLFYERVS